MGRYAFDGSFVLVPARVAYLLSERLDVSNLRIEARGRDAELAEVLSDWHAIQLQFIAGARKESGSDCGTFLVTTSEPAGHSLSLCTTRQIANRADVTPRAVTKAIAAKRLPATFVSGRWWVTPEDAAAWVESRTA